MSDLPQTKKSLGQHWLEDPASLNSMADAADIARGDQVLEVGPGTGTLTEVLLARGAHVTAVELDESMATELSKKFADNDFSLKTGSILKFDLGEMPPDYKVVANIPYYLTSNLIRVLSEASNPPSKVVLLVQKEVAQRVSAGPGDMSLLSVSAQFYWEVSKGPAVPAKLFVPPPKVDSQILIMKRRETPLFSDLNVKDFFRIVKAGFSSRRKTLHNSLSGGLHLSKLEVLTILKEAEVDRGVRAQELSLNDWYKLYLCYNNGN